jgi:arginine:ornithine antiporter/lysine permease
LWATNVIIQLFVISTYWSTDAFGLMLSLTSVMSLIPYLFVAGYGLLISSPGASGAPGQQRIAELLPAAIAVLYTVFLVFAGGLKFLLLSAILYAPGTVLFFWSKYERGKSISFERPIDWILFLAAAAGCVIGIVALVNGSIQI